MCASARRYAQFKAAFGKGLKHHRNMRTWKAVARGAGWACAARTRAAERAYAPGAAGARAAQAEFEANAALKS